MKIKIPVSLAKFPAIALVVLLYLLQACEKAQERTSFEPDYTTWESYLGGPDRNHYSTLSQISPQNVDSLKVAWTYEAPDYGQMQMNPIVVDSILYAVTAALRLVAIDAATGKELWRFGDSLQAWHSTSRGVSYWAKGKDKRIFYTRGPELYAIDALSGVPVASFGDGGKIDLRSGMPEAAKDKFVISNTPGTIYEDLIIMPLRVSEDIGAAPGDIMAFNTVNGKTEWVFHTIPYPGEAGYETWQDSTTYQNEYVGAANNWSGMAVDMQTGILW